MQLMADAHSLYIHNSRAADWSPLEMTFMRAFSFIFLLWQLGGASAADDEASLCGQVSSAAYVPGDDFTAQDKLLLANALNLEFLEAEYFLRAATGRGLDSVDPRLSGDGPQPRGAQQASLDPLVRDIVTQFGYQEVGHVRALRESLKEEFFPRPQLDVSVDTWATMFDQAFGEKLEPPFNPYEDSLKYMLSAYAIPYVGLTGYVGANPRLQGSDAKRLLVGLLGVEAGQDAVVRGYLYERKHLKVEPYPYTVAEFTNKLSALRTSLDDATGVDDEGLVVPKCLGAERKIDGNILVGDQDYFLSYGRTAEQVLQVVYGTGDVTKPGGFFPEGGNGKIAEKYLTKRDESGYIYC